jgi:hypothetical protein
LAKPQQFIDSLGLDSLDRGYSTDCFVERSDLSYPSGFRASYEVGSGKIKPLAFVQGNRSQEQRSVNDSDGLHRQQGSNCFTYARTVDLVERFEYKHRFGNDEISEVETLFIPQKGGSSPRHVGWITNQMTNQNVGVDKRTH